MRKLNAILLFCKEIANVRVHWYGNGRKDSKKALELVWVTRGGTMPIITRNLLEQYTEILKKIYGKHLKTVILYGSYARGDYREDSDIDIMILLDLSDMDIKQYRHELSGETFDFNMDHDLDIKPIAKSQQHFQNWVEAYPFYANVEKEGVKLFEAA